MRLGVMQPYFLPYIGYFSLIKHTDHWVVFDNIQYIRHGWIDRNRILKPDEGWQYIKIPIIRHSRDTLIKDIRAKENTQWARKIISQVEHYRKVAPFYSKVLKCLQKIESIRSDSIVDINIQALSFVCEYLDIPFDYSISSELNIDWERVKQSDDWALLISKHLMATEYWNPIGGREIFNQRKYTNADIKLRFHSINVISYNQRRADFIPSLSIIDVMMFNHSNDINEMLDKYELK